MKSFFTLLFAFAFYLMTFGQNGAQYWADATIPPVAQNREATLMQNLRHYRGLQLDVTGLRSHLRLSPMEFTTAADENPTLLNLPLPNGQMATFAVVESPVFEPGLGEKYAFLKTYSAHSLTPGIGNARIGFTAKGFHASIFTQEGTVYIDPHHAEHPAYYLSYYTRENQPPAEQTAFTCGVGNEEVHIHHPEPTEVEEEINFRNPQTGEITLRTYRMAMACTGEYAGFHGGTTEQALSAIVAAVNRLNLVMERDLAIRFVLVDNNDTIIYLDGDSDPYTNANTGAMISENIGVCNSNIGVGNYDIGHVLGTHPNLAGLAALQSICSNGFMNHKAAGASTINSPVGDQFVIAIVGHELGHQMGANHSFNSCGTQGEDNVNPGTGYEPGGGTTMMSYAGICSSINNIQFFTDDYYHTISLQEMFGYTRFGTGSSCPVEEVTTNIEPDVFIPYPDDLYIPISTPFKLTASAVDANGDELTYCWEQYDLYTMNAPPGMPVEDSPLFRSFPPTTSPTRIFPRLDKIVNLNFDNSEVLPTYSRPMTFRCTVRDNNPQGGAAVWDQYGFQSTETAGPFFVSQPSFDTIQWEAGSWKEVTWAVANTDGELVNCQEVNIHLSIDGGFTYPIVLALNVPNDGSQFVTIPNIITDQARVRVEAADHIFFDISNFNFDIIPATTPSFSVVLSPATDLAHCLPTPFSTEIVTESFLGYDSLLTLELLGELPPSASYEFSANPIVAGETSELTINLDPMLEDEFNLQVRIITSAEDTLFRDLRFATLSKDFSDLEQVSPEDGNTELTLGATFTWTDALQPLSYNFELATSPVFGDSIVNAATGIIGNEYQAPIILESGTHYFWRIQPRNECGEGEWLAPFSFFTQATSCAPIEADDVPVNISGSGLPTVESTLFIPTEGVISDLNVPLVRANYQPVNSLRFTLISPAGTEVVLFDQNCGTTVNLLMGFDDDAPTDIVCPPDDGIVFKPVQSLSAFEGESTFGEWIMRVQVVESGFGASGAISDWGLEFCATIQSSPPALIKNDTLYVPPGEGNVFTTNELEVIDEDNADWQLRYTIVSPPIHGTLFLLDQPLGLGDVFRQTTINANNLAYIHDGSDTEFDSFLFTVTDGSGGLIPNTQFNIRIEEGAMVATEEVLSDQDILVFPNPTTGLINVQFRQTLEVDLTARLFNLQGQMLKQEALRRDNQNWQMDASQLPPGVYMLSLQSGDAVWTKRVVVQR